MTDFRFIAGSLCLDFVNTASWNPGEADETLSSFDALVEWGRSAGILGDDGPLLERAEREPERAQRTLRNAIAGRRVLHTLFASLTDADRPDSAALEKFNHALSRALPRLAVCPEGDGFRWGWQHRNDDFRCILSPVLWSVAELLTSADIARVASCCNDRCGWLFVDRSRRGNRRWCQMSECGSRDKARRYYHRHHAKQS